MKIIRNIRVPTLTLLLFEVGEILLSCVVPCISLSANSAAFFLASFFVRAVASGYDFPASVHLNVKLKRNEN